MRTVINNPDIKKEFPVWYFCNNCHETRKADSIMLHSEKCTNYDIRTISTDKPFIIVGEDDV
jgi:hypothetical protein